MLHLQGLDEKASDLILWTHFMQEMSQTTTENKARVRHMQGANLRRRYLKIANKHCALKNNRKTYPRKTKERSGVEETSNCSTYGPITIIDASTTNYLHPATIFTTLAKFCL